MSQHVAHTRARVLTSRQVGAYRHVTLAVPGLSAWRPGQFVALSPLETHLARRPYWIHQVKPAGGYAATVEIVVEPFGPSGRRLAAMQPGDELPCTAPLGRPFLLPKEPDICLLVGVGHHASPLVALAGRLRERGCAVTMMVAAADEAHLLSALEARRSARSVTVVTVDGSVGLRGTTLEHLPALVERTEPAVVYASAPVPDAHAIARLAEEHGVWSQTAVETRLTCATGLCQGCPVPVVGEDGSARVARACADGPVFRGDRVRWAELEDWSSEEPS